jgi:hypothetical protein
MAKGEGKGLQAAFDDAFGNVPQADKHKWHKATQIFVKGSNPIDMYRVILSPTNDPDPGGSA